MRALKMRWYVFGAQAVIVYGRPRMTADVDVTVDIGSAPVQLLRNHLEREGFENRAPGFEEALASSRLWPLFHCPTDMPVDLVLAVSPLEDEFFSRVTQIALDGVAIPFLSVEDLVALKVLAGRNKDQQDVAGIFAERRPKLDEPRIYRVLKALESEAQVLGLIDRFEQWRDHPQ